MATQPTQDNASFTTFSHRFALDLTFLPSFREGTWPVEVVGRKSGLDEEDELEDDDELIDDEDDDVDDLEDDDEDDDLDDEDDELEDDEDEDEEDEEDEEEEEDDEVKPLKVK